MKLSQRGGGGRLKHKETFHSACSSFRKQKKNCNRLKPYYEVAWCRQYGKILNLQMCNVLETADFFGYISKSSTSRLCIAIRIAISNTVDKYKNISLLTSSYAFPPAFSHPLSRQLVNTFFLVEIYFVV